MDERFIKLVLEYVERGFTGYFSMPLLPRESIDKLYIDIVNPQTKLAKTAEDLCSKIENCLEYLSDENKKEILLGLIKRFYPKGIFDFIADIADARINNTWKKIRAEHYLAYLLGKNKWNILGFKSVDLENTKKAMFVVENSKKHKYVIGVITAEKDGEAEEIARDLAEEIIKTKEGTPILFTFTSENKNKIVSTNPAILRLFMAKTLLENLS